MSKFLEELLSDLGKPENELEDTVTDIEEPNDTVDETEDSEESVTEEIEPVEETSEASEETDAEDDDETELSPVERKAYGRLKALQDERDKRRTAEESRKAAEAETERLRNEMAEMHRQNAARSAQNLPDPHDDLEGYIAARDAHYQTELLKQSLGHSIERAVDKHGEDEVVAATQWFESQIKANPSINLRQNMLSQKEPLEYVVSSYKQSQAMTAFASGDVSAIVANLQKAGYVISKADTTVAAPAATANPKPAAATTATVRDAPAAPKRSKLAGSTSAITAPSANLSMKDHILRRR